jgi:predicted transposase/invertase (TIGR01784 family)
MIKEKYIDPFTDFGFKWLFGNEKHKDILIKFLNDLIDDLAYPIVKIEYRNLEKLGLNIIDRRAVFDVYCTDSNNDHFIVELQRSKQKFFKDRSVYYTSFPIQEQAQKGSWNYELDKVYFIALLEFNIDDDENYIKKVSLYDEYTKKQFYDKLTYYYIEMPKFKKTEQELSTHLDEWLYILNNMIDLVDIPKNLQDDKVLKEFFDVAEFIKLSKDRQFAYQQELKAKLDYINVMRYAKEEAQKVGHKIGLKKGIEQGIEQEKITIAKNLLDILDDETISIKTGLDVSFIKSLR